MKDTFEEMMVNNILYQAEQYLKELGAFYPFGCAIDKNNRIVPLSAYSENDNPPAQELIEVLEAGIIKNFKEGNYFIAGIAVDVLLKEADRSYDAIEIRIVEKGNEQYKKQIKYTLKDGKVEFGNIQS
ncbi:hypothetical protein [Pedobacter sp. ASV12]|uniref:hypothetical protein n=1 Tax=Pedobacter sp. ASV12 TaxID=2795120 RepID=UPI0018EBF333|nr:hypothetical protein [Pedobacter sp. ASV12]